MISYQIEDWFATKLKMEWLFPLHWKEVATYKEKIKLDLDYESYDELASKGDLLIITVRDGLKIVGYYWLIVKKHLHYKKSLTAFTDMFFLHPDYRKGMVGVNIFKFAEKILKEKGVERLIVSSKTSHDKSKIFERLKFDKVETVYTKFIGK